MLDLSSKLFTPYTHPESGVTTYLLTHKVAPVQEAFYFVNNSSSTDGRYLWFYCAFPPGGSAGHGRTLGVVDFETMQVRHFPETMFQDASPMVDPDSQDAMWGTPDGVYRRGPQPKDEVRLIGTIPDEVTGGRVIRKMATHLTRSCDGKELFLDAGVGLQYLFGSLTISDGSYEFWHRFDRCYNHAQFSPTNPNQVLFAQEMHNDPLTGMTFPITNRLWLLERGKAPRALLREPRWVSHEWWDAGGQHAWSVWANQAWKVDINTGEEEYVDWPNHCWHAHATLDNSYMVADSNDKFFRGCPSSVGFTNRKTGRYVRIIENPAMLNQIGRSYHIDPHPRFVFNDQYIVFTTTLRGEVDLAVVPVDQLIDRTS
jgi:hypothetical protein